MCDPTSLPDYLLHQNNSQQSHVWPCVLSQSEWFPFSHPETPRYKNFVFFSQITVYRPDTICHCLIFIPIFYMCGRCGYTFLNRHIDEEPWRIVLPCVVCFAGVTIIQFVYIVLLHIHITFYCNDVRGDFPKHRTKSCEYLIDLDSKVSVAWHYRTVYYSAMITFLLWLGATVIMMVRVLRAPDFKVVIDKQRKEKLDPGQQ